MAKKIIEVDCAPDTTYKVNVPTIVTGQFPEFCKCTGVAVINISTEENVDLSYDQSNGMYQASPISKTEPAAFEYKVICKNPDPCPECPECKGEVSESTGRVEIPALCVSCLPQTAVNDFTDENLPDAEDIELPDVDCDKVLLPYTVTNEYYNGYVRFVLDENCEWGEPIIRDLTDGGLLSPAK